MLATLAVLLLCRVPKTGQAAPEGTVAAPLIHRAVIRPGLALFTGVAGTAGFLALVGQRAAEVGFPAWSLVPLLYGVVVVGCRIMFARVPDRLPTWDLGAASLGLCTIGLKVLASVPARRACSLAPRFWRSDRVPYAGDLRRHFRRSSSP